MTGIAWVLIDESQGVGTADGGLVSPAVLAHVVEAVSSQLNGEFAREHGGAGTMRIGSGPSDVLPGERVMSFLPALPGSPDDVAYHSVDGAGAPFALVCVPDCKSLYGADTGLASAASHEVLEAAKDEGCNLVASTGFGHLVDVEVCDPVEVQSYAKTCADGTVVYVSNWVLRSWFVPGAPAPYDYMSEASLPGAAAPPGPMQIAPGDGGNYLVQYPPLGTQVSMFGLRQKGVAHWSSRAARRGWVNPSGPT